MNPNTFLTIYGVVGVSLLVVGQIYLTIDDGDAEDRVIPFLVGATWPLITVGLTVYGVGYTLLYWVPLRVRDWLRSRRPAVVLKSEPPERGAGPYRGGACEKCGRPL